MGLKLIVLLFALCSFVIQTDHPKQKQQKEKVQKKKTDKPKVTDSKELSNFNIIKN